jgi:hypothetical protein
MLNLCGIVVAILKMAHQLWSSSETAVKLFQEKAFIHLLRLYLAAPGTVLFRILNNFIIPSYNLTKFAQN